MVANTIMITALGVLNAAHYIHHLGTPNCIIRNKFDFDIEMTRARHYH